MNFATARRSANCRRGYETLLLEIIEGDQTLFVHADEVDAAWTLYTPLLESPRTVYPYAAGSGDRRRLTASFGAPCGGGTPSGLELLASDRRVSGEYCLAAIDSPGS